MQANELFRMMSLRKPRPADPASPTISRDNRLRYRELLDAQKNVHATERSVNLAKLKVRHRQLAQTVRDLEDIQRVVVSVVMGEEHKRRTPFKGSQATSSDRSATKKTRSASRSTAPASEPPFARSIVIDANLSRVIEEQLPERQARLYKQTVARIAGGRVADLTGILTGLEVSTFLDEANRNCAQIRALEESLSADLPVVPSSESETEPIVAAIGWGELILARETLVGYTAREVAHIENVLPGETKVREHRRTTKTEQVEEVETITERESEKDSQTTDRYELQSQSQETIQRNFSISAGVNVSAKYGVTEINASLDTAFAQSQSQSRSNAISTAQEIIKKTVERTYERVRKLRRLTLTEEITELNTHTLANVASPLNAISGIYLWAEKIQRVELRHYGTRMMVEFHIPEPAVSLLEDNSSKKVRRRLPALDIGPTDVDPANYLCLAERYGAVDVVPPPPQFAHVGFGWVSTLNEEAENWAEDQFTDVINIPAGYTPEWARVAWSGLRGTKENREFNFAFAVAGVSEQPETKEHTVATWNGVVLRLPAATTWPQGVPVSGRVRGSWDGAMYVQVVLTCRRTAEALDSWRIRTWEALRAGYEALERKLVQEEQREAYERSVLSEFPSGAPAEENRRIERTELQKWAVKAMRALPQNFNAIERVGEFEEPSPKHADAQAPIVSFYENSFEWEHMNYFLFAYHWARRASWQMRKATRSADPLHQRFLEAGAARLIVPVTPGYEDKVLAFLDPENRGKSELERILGSTLEDPPTDSNNPFRDLWVELLLERKPDAGRGSGTLKVKNGDANVEINSDSRWRASNARDVGRELFIEGEKYEVRGVTDPTKIVLDRAYAGDDSQHATYAAESVPFGPPWTVNIPTSLIVLADNRADLQGL